MLREKDFEYIYRNYESTPVRFDCGKLCAPENGGIPYCCDTGWLIPVMYKWEFSYLLKHTDLWVRFKPKTKHEKNIIEETDKNTVFGQCLGHKGCDRKYRSVSCRIFPFEPYLDLEGKFLGMVYSYRLGNKCPLVDKPKLVSKKFISDQTKMWTYIFERDSAERQVYREQSIQVRRYLSRKKKPIYIFTPEGYSRGKYRLR
ncbi:MAG: hypothetical protein JSV84_09095 [Gemmatimonadota bacterium]|nr:MAG: hypothetical protein JSV84_09095 [Gemmatimonadota bacterium]